MLWQWQKENSGQSWKKTISKNKTSFSPKEQTSYKLPSIIIIVVILDR